MLISPVVQEVLDEFGRIDILVNSAGINGSEKLVLKMSEDDMDDVMKVDFRGVYVVSRAVAGHMVERKSGRIINVS